MEEFDHHNRKMGAKGAKEKSGWERM